MAKLAKINLANCATYFALGSRTIIAGIAMRREVVAMSVSEFSSETHLTLPPAGLLTRKRAAQFIRETLGCPMSFSTATKLAALGEFAEPALWWGRRPLYRREDLKTWAERRGRPAKPYRQP